uniref:Phosphatase domain containing paladin 1b n=1 Tax=Cyprinus carpio carpio TaxID=630221 RepID=A0A9J8ARA7_CYPCA
MGTSASATSQAAPFAPTHQADHQGNGMAEHRRFLQSVNIRNSKAKSIITNKVAPVVITKNCREEFQIHDKIQSANYSMGRISDLLPEHYLVLGEFFMVQDVYNRADVLNTTKSHGSPNFRKVKGNYPLFGMGQPSLSGFKQVLQRLQIDGCEEVIFICLREEPVVFFRSDGDFIPYTPRGRENLHENLHDLDRELSAEQIELSIRKELCDFAKLSENMFYVYNDIEHFKDEPQQVQILSEEDIHVTEEVYKRPLFSQPLHRYYRLPLPMEGAPLEETFDAFVNILRETPNLSLMRDSSRPLPALLFSCQVGVGRTNLGLILGALVFHRLQGASKNPRYLLNCQYNFNYCLLSQRRVSSEFLATDLLSTAKEMKVANFRRVSKMALYGMAQPNSEALAVVMSYLTDQRRGHSTILWLNLQEELVLEANGQMFTPREPGSLAIWPSPQEMELALKQDVLRCEKWLEVITEQDKQMRMFKTCHTIEELFVHQKSIHPGLSYQRIPMSDCCAPKEEVFDHLLEAMKSSLAENPKCAFIFNCHNGKDRTTAAMVIATLTLWHINGFPECEEDEIVSVPDAKYTKGEFEVVMQVVRVLPDGHRVKREVDVALDVVSETMTPMHYHLREIIISTYRQVNCDVKYWCNSFRSQIYIISYIYCYYETVVIKAQKSGI